MTNRPSLESLDATIDVIVPVYRDEALTRRCLNALLRTRDVCRVRFEIIVIDDCSPEPLLSRWLCSLAGEKQICLICHDQNQGFVRAVNAGMALHPDRDVVLLNSDAEVANDWLDRLHRAAYSADDIGTVTPFSNNATICSWPDPLGSAELPKGWTLPRLDEQFAQRLDGQGHDLPTAVGFCMYIKRACLAQIGLFDAERFGKGYGEENEFCRRAVECGWRHRLAADVFVYHHGAASFGESQQEAQKVAREQLLACFPDYEYHVEAFLSQDPLASYRRVMDEASGLLPVESEDSQRRVQLHITHGWGGGVERFVSDFCREDPWRRNLVLRSRSDRNVAGYGLELVEPRSNNAVLARWRLSVPVRATDLRNEEYEAILEQVVEGFHVETILVSSLIGHALAPLKTRLPTAFIMHDLYPFCPALFAHVGTVACEECDLSSLSRCHQQNPRYAFWHNTRPEAWTRLRGALNEALAQPNVKLVAPSVSARNRWQTLMPSLLEKTVAIFPHGMSAFWRRGRESGLAAAKLAKGERLRVLIPGRLSEHKGLWLLNELLPRASAFADFLLLGCGEFGEPFADCPGVRVVVEYDERHVWEQVRHFSPHCALLASTLAETFSYALSEMWALGLPVIATDQGALGERVIRGVNGWLVAPNASSMLELLHELHDAPQDIEHVQRAVAGLEQPSVPAMVMQYHALLPLPVRYGLPRLYDGLALARVERSRSEGAECECELTRLREQVACLKNAQKAFFDSRSWRLTAPLRRCGEWLRQKRARLPRGKLRGVAEVGHPTTPALECEISPQELRFRLGLPDRTRLLLFPGDGDWAAVSDYMKAEVLVRNDTVVLLPGDVLLPSLEWRLWVSSRRVRILPNGIAIGAIGLAIDGMFLDGELTFKSGLGTSSSRVSRE